MPEYLEYGPLPDEAALKQAAFEFFAQRIPGWAPSPGDPITILVEVGAQQATRLAEIVAFVSRAIFRAFGASVVGLAPVDATRAQVPSTWTVVDGAGYTIRAGTVVGISRAGDELVAFEVLEDVVVPGGSTATATGEVILIAVEPGVVGSGLDGTPQLIDALAYIEQITLEGITTGGVDGESDEDYLDRLSVEFRLFTPRPILPRDFAILARRVGGVERATVLDGYDPGAGTFENERMVTVSVVDAAGNPLSAGAKAEVKTLLEDMREVNFVVHVVDPTYTPVDVSFTAVAHHGWDPPDVEARAVAAVSAYVSPAGWGLPALGDPNAPAGWANETVVRYLEVAAVLDRIEGLNYITALTINAVAADFTLTGPIAMPTAGVIAGTVEAP